MAQQWIRKISLVIEGSDGRGLELGQLRVTFDIRKDEAESPNTAVIRVYGLSDNTLGVLRQEGKRVVLSAGHEGDAPFGVIFDGNLVRAVIERNPPERCLTLICRDGDTAYGYSMVSTTLAAGSTAADRIAVCQRSMATNGVSQGKQTYSDGARMPRGVVMWGPARNELSTACRQVGAGYSIQDGKLQVTAHGQVPAGLAVLLTPATGLIGAGAQSAESIDLRCILNPLIAVGSKIIVPAEYVQASTDSKSPEARIATDGAYKVIGISMRGDTHGNDWTMDLRCLDIDQTINKTTVRD